jgi:hypothetical protein
MRRFLTLGAVLLTVSMAAAPTALGALSTSDLNTVTATDLANTLVGSGVTVSNVTYTGPTPALACTLPHCWQPYSGATDGCTSSTRSSFGCSS